MTTGYYADPTAWEAIARADSRPRNNYEAHTHDNLKGADGTCRTGVYHAPGAKTSSGAAFVFRPENRSVLAAIRRKLNEHDGDNHNDDHLCDTGMDQQ